MIISDKYRFVFIHIPKCAGTHVRSVIQAFDDTQGSFTHRDDRHDRLGMIDYAHIPMPVLERYFPDEYKKILAYETIAVIRNPRDRFLSSFSQHLRQDGKKNIHSMRHDEVIKSLESAVEWLRNNRDKIIYPPEYIHFMPQTSFIKIDDEVIVKNIFCIKDIDKVFECISKLTGQVIAPINLQVTNPTYVYKNKIYRAALEPMRIFYDLSKKILPKKVINRVKRMVFVSGSISAGIFDELPYLNDFIEEFYADDFHLYSLIREISDKDGI